MQIKKQQLELDTEQLTGSKLGKEYIKNVYCHPAYLTLFSVTMLQLTLQQHGPKLYGCTGESTPHSVIPSWLNPSVYGTAYEEEQLSAASGFPTPCRGLEPLSLAHTRPIVVKVNYVS